MGWPVARSVIRPRALLPAASTKRISVAGAGSGFTSTVWSAEGARPDVVASAR